MPKFAIQYSARAKGAQGAPSKHRRIITAASFDAARDELHSDPAVDHVMITSVSSVADDCTLTPLDLSVLFGLSDDQPG